MHRPNTSPAPWYRVENAAAASPTSADIHISDVIGGWGDDIFGDTLTAKSFVDALAALPDTVKTIRLHVNSPGGDVFAALNIANALRDQRVSMKRTVDVFVEGLAASAASIVLMAGTTISISDNALVMIHNPWARTAGDAAAMRAMADRLDKVRQTIIATYRWRSALSEQALGALMDATTWMDADEALANGFATHKVTGLKAAATIDRRVLATLAIPAKYSDRLTVLGLAATGTAPADRYSRTTLPGASGSPRIVALTTTKDPKMRTITEQIRDYEHTRAAKDAERTAIQNKVSDEGRAKDPAERESFDTLKGEIAAIDAELVDLREMEVANKLAAKPVDASDAKKATDSRAGLVIVSRVDKRPGIGFAKMAMCVAAAKGNLMQACEIAKQAYPHETEIHKYLNTAVAAGTTGNAQAPLLQYTDFLQDFVEYLRPLTIIGKFGMGNIPSLRKIPFNVRVATQTAGGSGYWVGQGKPTPLSKGTYGTITNDFMKVGSIQVLTKEEVRFANPSSEAKVRDDLAAGLVATTDLAFVDPANAGTANVKPASITNGVVGSAVSGTDADAVRVDLKTLIGSMISAGIQPNSVVLIMSQAIALSLTLMRNALGGREFPDMTINGGLLDGFPVIASEHLTAVGSPSTGTLIAVNASDVYLSDDGNVEVEASDQASLEMLDQTLLQDGTTGTGASTVSLWQSGLLGLKAEREITWKMRRAAAVAYCSPVAYTPST